MKQSSSRPETYLYSGLDIYLTLAASDAEKLPFAYILFSSEMGICSRNGQTGFAKSTIGHGNVTGIFWRNHSELSKDETTGLSDHDVKIVGQYYFKHLIHEDGPIN